MIGKICIAEAEHIVPAGTIKPDEIHLPGIYVDYVIYATHNEKRIERLKMTNGDTLLSKVSEGRVRMIQRAAKEFNKTGLYVNLGIGIPTMTSNFVPPDVHIELQAQIGLLGVGTHIYDWHVAVLIQNCCYRSILLGLLQYYKISHNYKIILSTTILYRTLSKYTQVRTS